MDVPYFYTLLDFNVNFIPDDTITEAEQKCSNIEAGFIFGHLENFLESAQQTDTEIEF